MGRTAARNTGYWLRWHLGVDWYLENSLLVHQVPLIKHQESICEPQDHRGRGSLFAHYSLTVSSDIFTQGDAVVIRNPTDLADGLYSSLPSYSHGVPTRRIDAYEWVSTPVVLVADQGNRWYLNVHTQHWSLVTGSLLAHC